MIRQVIFKNIKFININDETFNLTENQHIFIPQGAKHRLANRGDQTLIVIEMWFGELLDENDIKRYED